MSSTDRFLTDTGMNWTGIFNYTREGCSQERKSLGSLYLIQYSHLFSLVVIVEKEAVVHRKSQGNGSDQSSRHESSTRHVAHAHK